jgi:hypothetical protein
MKYLITTLVLIVSVGIAIFAAVPTDEPENREDPGKLSLITNTPEEGFQIAIDLARKGVTETQTDRDVLFTLRDVYANDPNALIASSHVIAIHFQTVAAANNYWLDKK